MAEYACKMAQVHNSSMETLRFSFSKTFCEWDPFRSENRDVAALFAEDELKF